MPSGLFGAEASGCTAEGERIEYKTGWNPDPILRTLCAFANDFENLGGGYVVIGQDCDTDGRPVFPSSGVPEREIDRIQTFYQQKGTPRLQTRVTHFAAKLGVRPGELAIKDIGYRWASCQPNGKLHVHWKCMMAPATILDYVVVHELCHLRYRDHSAAFWNEADKVLPDYAERKEWLRQRGLSWICERPRPYQGRGSQVVGYRMRAISSALEPIPERHHLNPWCLTDIRHVSGLSKSAYRFERRRFLTRLISFR